MPRPISPYGVTKLCVEHLAYAHARTTGPRRGRRALLHGLRPAPAARHGVHAPARGARRRASVPPLRRRRRPRAASRSSPTRSTGRSPRWSAAAGRALQRRRRRGGDDERGDRARGGRSPARELRVERHGAATGDVRRTRADVGKAERELGWRADDRRSRTVSGPSGTGSLVGSRPRERGSADRRRRPRRRARGRPPVGLVAHLAARWWLPLGGLVVGAILGVLVSVGSGDVYRAEALIYLGQPFTPAGGGQIQSLQTNPKTVSEIDPQRGRDQDSGRDAADMRPGGSAGTSRRRPSSSAGQVARNFTPLVADRGARRRRGSRPRRPPTRSPTPS